MAFSDAYCGLKRKQPSAYSTRYLATTCKKMKKKGMDDDQRLAARQPESV